MPDAVSGAYFEDPEIELIAKKYNLKLDFTYASDQDYDFCYGLNRSCSADARVYADPGVGAVVVAGDFSEQGFIYAGESGGITTYTPDLSTGATTTLSMDSTGLYTQYFNDGSRYYYKQQAISPGDAARIVKFEDATGLVHTYTYENLAGASVLSAIEVPGGNRVSFLYGSGDPVSLLSGVEDWTGRQWSFEYDASRDLTTFTTPNLCSTGYGYTVLCDQTTVLCSITDSRGCRTHYNYDSDGRVVAIWAGHSLWTWSYQPDRSVLTTPSGARTTYNFDTSPEGPSTITSIEWPKGYVSKYSYAANSITTQEETGLGFVYSVTYDERTWQITASDDVFGNRTTYQYDSFGNLTTQIAPDGGVTAYGYGADPSQMLRVSKTNALDEMTRWNYYPDGLLETATDPRGLVTTYNWDSLGNLASVQYSDGGVVTNQYDALNRLTTVTDQIGRATSYAYDLADNMVGRTDPTGASWRYIYDRCLVQATVDPLGNRTTNTWGRFDTLLTVEDANGNVTSTAYDSLGYPVAQTDALGNVSTTVYDAAKQVVGRIDPLGSVTTLQWDIYGRQVATVDANGSTTRTAYDARGNVTQTTDALGFTNNFTYDNMGRQISAQDALGYTSQTQYDLLGRTTALTDPLGKVTRMGYDAAGNLVTITDANGIVTTNVYASNSERLAASVDGNGNRVSFVYDLAGEQIAVQNARGFFTSMSYDGAGRLASQVNALGETTVWFYDAAGRNTTMIDAIGNIKTMSYDNVGNLTNVLYADGSRVTYLMDRDYRVTMTQDSTGDTAKIYSARGELVSITYPGGRTLQYGFDGVGNRRAMLDEDIGLTEYSYDAAGNLVSIVNQKGELTEIRYDPVGREVRRTTAELSIQRMYDAAGRLTFQTNAIDYGPQGAQGTGMGFAAVYDNVGNRLSVRHDDGSIVSYSYDNAYQLTGEQYTVPTGDGFSYTYSYDPAGNRLTKGVNGSLTNYEYNAADELTTIVPAGGSVVTQAFDRNGNLLSRYSGGDYLATYSWNSDNRLTGKFVDGSALLSYAYSAEGYRQSIQVAGSGPVSLTWDGANALKVNAFGGETTFYNTDNPGYWGGLTSLGIRIPGQYLDGTFYFGYDLQGNVCAFAAEGEGGSELGTAGSYVPYTSYGEALDPVGLGPAGYNGLYGYQSDSWLPIDQPDAWLYVRDRYYDPDTGRWVSRDRFRPARRAANPYAYCYNAPLSFVDPTGLFSCGLCWISPGLLGGLCSLFCGGNGFHVGPYVPGKGWAPWYGNYCGPQSFVPGSSASNPYPHGTNCLDECCRDHDQCYEAHVCRPGQWITGSPPECRACDLELCNCAAASDCGGDPGCYAWRAGITAVMCAHGAPPPLYPPIDPGEPPVDAN
jgi:RHS repeat-associated protein